MIKFTRSTKKKIDKVRSGGSSVAAPPDDNATNGSGSSPQHHHSSRSRRNSKSRNSQPHATTDHSVASAYSQRSDYTSETGYSSANNNNYNGRAAGTGGAPTGGGGGGRSIAGSSVATNNSRRFSSAASVASISSASVFSPSVTPSVKMSTGGLLPPGGIGGGGGASIASEQNSTAIGNHHGLQPSSARLLRDLNNSARSSLLSSLGTAASRTFRSYKMTLPRCPPPVKTWDGSTSSVMGGSGSKSSVVGHQHHHHGSSSGATATNGTQDNEDELTLESDLELLGRTVHAVSSALTEPPKDNDRFMVYDVSFNPKGCVWDALIVVQLEKDDGDTNDHHHDDDDDNRSRSSTRSNTSRTSQSHQQRRRSTSRNKGRRSNSRSVSRSRRLRSSSRSKQNHNRNDDNGNKTFSFPIRVTCAEDDIGGSGSNDSILQQQHQQQQQHRYNTPTTNSGQGPHPKRAKTYAVDLAVIDDMPHHPISSWSASEAANYRDDMKNAMEWVSYGIRRSMARSMFPQFPEGCQGRPFREIYQLNKKLKSGTFSTVCRGVHRATGKQVAVKCILRKKIEPSVDAAVFEEVLIMSGLHHRYICPMIDYFEEDRCHFVVMELEKGGDLCERLNDKVTYSEPDARTVVRNICEAMEFVHNKGFAHCDIKPRNYLLRSKRDDVDVRLADFGFAQHVHAPNSLTSQCGTPFFVAPEVINRKPYDQKVDMWSIGVTTYLLLSGETPFNGKNRQQLFRRISCDEPTFSDDKWGNVSDVAIDFVLRLLTKDPAKRMSASEALRHEWFVGLDRAKAPMNASASMGTSEDFSIGTDHSKKSRDPPPQVSPTRKSSRASRPPPPPKPSSRRGDDRSSSDRDENARLLDVIKEQDAKIEKLEAMVKRMLEPEGAVHEC